jgi:hypothetical protein
MSTDEPELSVEKPEDRLVHFKYDGHLPAWLAVFVIKWQMKNKLRGSHLSEEILE